MGTLEIIVLFKTTNIVKVWTGQLYLEILYNKPKSEDYS